jgi:DNA-binding response OmpR family regulator
MVHTVLVVEDEEDLREMIRDGLELSGYNVVTAQEVRRRSIRSLASSTCAWCSWTW